MYLEATLVEEVTFLVALTRRARGGPSPTPARGSDRGRAEVGSMSRVTPPHGFRFFADDASGVVLWSDEGAEDLDALPMSNDLRDRIQAWVDEYTVVVGSRGRASRPADWFVEHDRLGESLCQELSQQLVPPYTVRYEPHTRDVREAAADTRNRAP